MWAVCLTRYTRYPAVHINRKSWQAPFFVSSFINYSFHVWIRSSIGGMIFSAELFCIIWPFLKRDEVKMRITSCSSGASTPPPPSQLTSQGRLPLSDTARNCRYFAISRLLRYIAIILVSLLIHSPDFLSSENEIIVFLRIQSTLFFSKFESSRHTIFTFFPSSFNECTTICEDGSHKASWWTCAHATHIICSPIWRRCSVTPFVSNTCTAR